MKRFLITPYPGQNGVPPARSGLSTIPQAGQDRVPPFQNRIGYHPSRTGLGTPQSRTGWGTPHPPWQAMLGQVTVWAVRLLWFPAGRLSCFKRKSQNWMHSVSSGKVKMYFFLGCANLTEEMLGSSAILGFIQNKNRKPTRHHQRYIF